MAPMFGTERPDSYHVRNLDNESRICGQNLLRLFPSRGGNQHMQARKNKKGFRRGWKKYEGREFDLSSDDILFANDHETSSIETSEGSLFLQELTPTSSIPQFHADGPMNKSNKNHTKARRSEPPPTIPPPRNLEPPDTSEKDGPTFQFSSPPGFVNTTQEDDTFDKPVDVLPCVTEVVTEDYAEISQASAESTISTNETGLVGGDSSNVDKQPDPMLLAMREMIAQQQNNLESLAAKNKTYRDRLEESQDCVLNLRKEQLDQKDAIMRLRLERESFEAEAVWLREELKTIKLELTNMKTTSRVAPMMERRNPEERKPQSILHRTRTTPRGTSEVRWSRSQYWSQSDRKGERDPEETLNHRPSKSPSRYSEESYSSGGESPGGRRSPGKPDGSYGTSSAYRVNRPSGRRIRESLERDVDTLRASRSQPLPDASPSRSRASRSQRLPDASPSRSRTASDHEQLQLIRSRMVRSVPYEAKFSSSPSHAASPSPSRAQTPDESRSNSPARHRLYERARKHLEYKVKSKDSSGTTTDRPVDIKWVRAQQVVLERIRDDVRSRTPERLNRKGQDGLDSDRSKAGRMVSHVVFEDRNEMNEARHRDAGRDRAAKTSERSSESQRLKDTLENEEQGSWESI